MTIMLRQHLRRPERLRTYLTRVISAPATRPAHTWTPDVSAAPNADGPPLAFFTSYPSPRRNESIPNHMTQNHDLYGQLVVSALLNPALQAHWTSNDQSDSSEPERRPDPPDGEEISDQEWEIRTGRAIYILQQTLPDYFLKGLVSSLEIPLVHPESPPAADSSWLKNALGLSDTADSAGESKAHQKAKAKAEEDTGSIYSPHVRLTYTPPIPLPAPFPKTLHVESLHLYTASSVFLRHTMNALYTDLHIELSRVRVQGPGARPPAKEPAMGYSKSSRISREKSFVVSMSILGTGRVSKAPAQWDVHCTYDFSPTTGLVLHHSIDTIEPAPTQALFEALGKFGLLGGGSNGVGGVGGAS